MTDNIYNIYLDKIHNSGFDGLIYDGYLMRINEFYDYINNNQTEESKYIIGNLLKFMGLIYEIERLESGLDFVSGEHFDNLQKYLKDLENQLDHLREKQFEFWD